jgi:hypothetical protein
MIWLGTWCCYPSGCALCSSSENLSPGVKPGDNSFGSAQVTRKCDGQFIPHLGNAARSLNCSLAIRWCWCSRAAVSGLRVYKIYNGYWFFGRPTVEQLRLDLREALKRPHLGHQQRSPAGGLGQGRQGRVPSLREDAGRGAHRGALRFGFSPSTTIRCCAAALRVSSATATPPIPSSDGLDTAPLV